MRFLLNETVSGPSEALFIVQDFLEWFRRSDPASLTVFFTGPNRLAPLRQALSVHSKEDLPPVHFVENPVPLPELSRYYNSPVLVNEIVPYRRGDLFRLFRLTHPDSFTQSFENQAMALQYDVRYDQTLRGKAKAYSPSQLSPVQDALSFYHPHTILDCGCGAGANYFFLQGALENEGCLYHGIDRSRILLIKAIDLFQGESTSFHLGDVCALPFGNNSMDLVFCESLLPFVSNPLQALREMERVSKNGFFAALYCSESKKSPFPFDASNRCLRLDTGSTWKYFPQTTPNVFSLPLLSDIQHWAQSCATVSTRINNKDPFFLPLGVPTQNVFFYPKSWFEARRETFSRWNNRPLM
ncbi:MAG TPA: class I SAM-dependent methyltransferase [Thermotogota bacterium]|nr:class I SAM-dependent methyltransferase [Thermotogota bacterium]